MSATEIPVITDPLGQYWDQPPLSEILVDEEWALMFQSTLDALAEYSCSLPSGTYVGKMWKCRRIEGGWYLRWYDEIQGNNITINTRQIALI